MKKHAGDIVDWYEIYNETNHTFTEEKDKKLGGVINYGKMVNAIADDRDMYDQMCIRDRLYTGILNLSRSESKIKYVFI